MGLLQGSRHTVEVTLYPETPSLDEDGNTLLKPAAVGHTARAVVQPMEKPSDLLDAIGDVSEIRYSMRLVGDEILGANSAVEYRGLRYGIVGDPRVYDSSPRTAHVNYLLLRR